MPIYAEITSEEEKLLKKTVLEAQAAAVSSQSSAFVLAKLKKSKSAAMVGTAGVMKEIEQELKKIKQALPQLEEKPPLTKREKLARPTKPTAKSRAKKAKKTKYEQELEAIRERISKLG